MATEIGCFMKPEVGHAEMEIREFKTESVMLVCLSRERMVSVVQAATVRENVLLNG